MFKNFALGAAPIPGHLGYIATRYGKILSTRCAQGVPLRILQGQKHPKSGHLRASLLIGKCKECGGRSYALRFVHHLILETFVGPKPNGGVCRHLNSDPSDNRVNNLAWGTPQENMDDRARRGLYHRGEKNRGAKLSDEQVVEIRLLRREGWTLSMLAARYGMSQSQMSNICSGRQR
jgi:hypothetical protein